MKRVIGFTVGAGPFVDLAREMAAKNGALFGLEWRVISSAPVPGVEHWNPAWWKLWAFDLFADADVLVHLDADVLALEPWPVAKFVEEGLSFAGVRDEPMLRMHFHECELYGIDTACYLNSGAWMASRAGAAGVFEVARGLGPSWGRWLEQNALNFALQAGGVETRILPRVWNWLVHRDVAAVPLGVKCAHFCGHSGNVASILGEMRAWAKGRGLP